jgi:hypothetical protein
VIRSLCGQARIGQNQPQLASALGQMKWTFQAEAVSQWSILENGTVIAIVKELSNKSFDIDVNLNRSPAHHNAHHDKWD